MSSGNRHNASQGWCKGEDLIAQKKGPAPKGETWGNCGLLLYAAVCVKNEHLQFAADALQQFLDPFVVQWVSREKANVSLIQRSLRSRPERLKEKETLKNLLCGQKKQRLRFESSVVEDHNALDGAKSFLSAPYKTLGETFESVQLERQIWSYWSHYATCQKDLSKKLQRKPRKEPDKITADNVLDKCVVAYDALLKHLNDRSAIAKTGVLKFSSHDEVLGTAESAVAKDNCTSEVLENTAEYKQAMQEVQEFKHFLTCNEESNKKLQQEVLKMEARCRELDKQIESMSQLEATVQDLRFRNSEMEKSQSELRSKLLTTEAKCMKDQKRNEAEWVNEIEDLRNCYEKRLHQKLSDAFALRKSRITVKGTPQAILAGSSKSSDGSEEKLQIFNSPREVEEISDSRRPSETASRYKELFIMSYDVAVCLQEANTYNDKRSANFIMKILQIARKESGKELERLRKELLKVFCLSDTTAKNPFARKTVRHCMVSMSKIMPRDQAKSSVWKEAVKGIEWNSLRQTDVVKREVDNFLSKCISVCWDMVVQERPLSLVATHSTFNPSQHERFFTSDKTDEKINYFVWPCLMEEQTNKLWAKGKVVTGTNPTQIG